jgi:2-polyprenyl-3-methyl-5-hydroxy-6-metoxy-1,4-benzoquinol methylase
VGPSRCGRGEREDWNRRYAESELLWSAKPNRFLVMEVAGMTPGRALDLACGEGRNAIWLAERGWRVTAVDFSDVGLAKAQRLAARRGVDVDWQLADLRDYRPPHESFDLALVLYLHLAADARRLVLARAAEALAPAGMLLVIGHDLTNLTDGHGGPKNPAVLFTPEAVAGELAGLAIERAERVLRPVAVNGGTVDAIDALVRGRRAV